MTSSSETAQDEKRTSPSMPEPDDSRKPDSPTDLSKRSWFYVLRKTMHEFSEDQCTDLAAALTYYAVLAIFPAMIALISILGVIGEGPKAVKTITRHAQAAGLAGRPGHDHQEPRRGRQRARCRRGAGHRHPGRPVVRLRVRRRLRPRDEPHLRDPGGPPLLEAAARDAAAHRGGRRAGRDRTVDADRLRTRRAVDRQRDRARRHGGDRVVDREVADPGAGRGPRRGAALLRHPQRPAAQVPLDLHRCGRGHPGLGAGVGGLRVLRRATSRRTTRRTGRWPA